MGCLYVAIILSYDMSWPCLLYTSPSPRYVVAFVVVIMIWAVAASISSMKYKEESFAHYSMYRAVREQHQYLMGKIGLEPQRNTE